MITMIVGYPGSGKSTYAYGHAGEKGAVVDLDAIACALIGGEVHAAQADMQVTLAVNECMWQIADALDRWGKDAYVIRTAPGSAEYAQQGKHCARVYIDTPREVCRERCSARGDYDAEKFAKACGRVDAFMRAHGREFRIVSGV